MTDDARRGSPPSPTTTSTGPAWPGVLGTAWTLAGPMLLLYAATLLATTLSASVSVQAEYALVNVVIVLGLQVFVGTSGVLSFGHVAFVAVGAWTFGLTTVDPQLKRNLMPDLFGLLAGARTPTAVSVMLAALLAMVLALVMGPLLLRLNGLQAGIATFALLGVTTQVLTYWNRIGPPSGQSMVGVRSAWDVRWLLLFAMAALIVAWSYRHTRTARLLRASRENMTAAPGSGIHVTFHRVVAFVVSAGICGVGGALWAETNRTVQASQLSVGFTFTVIAMLVLGGTNSVWGAVVGVVVYTALDVVLVSLQSGLTLGGYIVTIPDGTRPLALGAILILMLLFRPQGVTGGRELSWPR
jgi:branched-chain amino acid transport system permease protein